jgi:SAM-dependent methyltransferase
VNEQQQLLQRVQDGFDAPEQVAHYEHEALSGLTPLENGLVEALPAAGDVLDVGCGAGRVALALARRGYQVVGVDVSTRLVQVATVLAARHAPSVRIHQVEAHQLPFPASHFAAAIAFKVYCYVPSRLGRLAYLEELARVLRPGAVLLLTNYVVPPEEADAYARDPQHRVTAAAFSTLEPRDTFSAGGGFVHWFTAEDLHAELASSVFAVEEFSVSVAQGTGAFMGVARLRASCDAS